MELIVLTQNICPKCDSLHIKLDEMKEEFDFDYTEINIDDTPEAVEQYGIMGTPVTILTDEDGEVTRVTGYDSIKEEDIEVLIGQLDF